MEYGAQLRAKTEIVREQFAVGLFTLPVARHAASVLGVEIEGSSVRDAERNLASFPTAGLLHPPVEQALQDERISVRPSDAIVLEPPRRGVERITLERIAALDAVQPVDMFPHAAHVECVVHLH